MRENAVRKHAHDVADPLYRPAQAQAFADAAETANIAKQKRDFDVPPFQQIGLQAELLGQLAREELLELDTSRKRGLLLLQACHSGRHSVGDQFDQHRLQFADELWIREPSGPPAIAVNGADDLAIGGEKRRRHNCGNAGQTVLLLGHDAWQLPKRPLFSADFVQDAEAGTPIVFCDL